MRKLHAKRFAQQPRGQLVSRCHGTDRTPSAVRQQPDYCDAIRCGGTGKAHLSGYRELFRDCSGGGWQRRRASTTRPRFDDATGNGPLGTPASTGDPKARVSYSAPDPHRSAQHDRFSRQGKALLPLKTVQSAAPPDGVAPPTAWTIGVQAFPRSSFRFQTKNFVRFSV